MNTLDATRELQRPLALLLNGDHVDLPAIAEQLLECRRVILREVAALGKAEATDKKEEAA
jgi:choline kinase